MSDLFDLPTRAPTGRELAEEGMKRAAEHAERVLPGWEERALEYFRLYATLHPSFMTEDVRAYADEKGFEQPPAVGAWGPVVKRAKKEGYVVSRGKAEAKSPGQHGKWMALWVSQIFIEGATHVDAEQE